MVKSAAAGAAAIAEEVPSQPHAATSGQTRVDTVKWQANFRGVDKDGQTKDEFHRDASCKPSSSAFEPLTRKVWMSAVAEYDTPENMLNHGSSNHRGPKGRTLKKWVLKVLSANDRIAWQLPTAANGSRKRKRNSTTN